MAYSRLLTVVEPILVPELFRLVSIVIVSIKRLADTSLQNELTVELQVLGSGWLTRQCKLCVTPSKVA